MAEEKSLLQQWQEYREQLQQQMNQAKERLVQIGMDEVAGNPINPDEKQQITDYLKEANKQMANAEATIQQLENQDLAQQEAENDDNPTHDDDTPEHDDEEHEESEEDREGEEEPDGRDRMRNNPENTPEDEHLPDDDDDRAYDDRQRQFRHENEQNRGPLQERMAEKQAIADAKKTEEAMMAQAKYENTAPKATYKDFMNQVRKMNDEINQKTADGTVDINGKQVKVGKNGDELADAMEKEAKKNGRATCSLAIGAGDERREVTFEATKDANGKIVYSITDPLSHDGDTQIINKKDGDQKTPKQLFAAQLFSSAKQAQLERDGNNIYMDLALSKDMSLRVCPADLDTDAHNRKPDGEKDFNFYLVKYELNENGDNTGKEQSFCQITDKNGKSAQQRVSELFNKYGLTQDDMKDLRKQQLNREAERKEARKERNKERFQRKLGKAAHAVAIDAPKTAAKFAKNKIEKAINDGADLGGMR